MKLEYLNGVRNIKLLHEMSPFEAAIHSYEELAKKHIERYKNLAVQHAKSSTTGTEAEREAELKESLRFLSLERKKLDTIASVQGQLDAYRESAMKATKGSLKERRGIINRLEAEGHHPTSVLEKYMRAEGTPKPSGKHAAHHIVPGSGKDKVINNLTRVHIHTHGIGINDPANGVYLVHKDKHTPHWSMPQSRGHRTYHTLPYEGWVKDRLLPLRNIDFIKTQLQVIGRILQDNEPKDIPGVTKGR